MTHIPSSQTPLRSQPVVSGVPRTIRINATHIEQDQIGDPISPPPEMYYQTDQGELIPTVEFSELSQRIGRLFASQAYRNSFASLSSQCSRIKR